MRHGPASAWSLAARAALLCIACFLRDARASAGGSGGSLQVFAAASLSEAFTEIGRRLEAERQGISVRLNFAGSQQLAAQIEQGAAADLFASADERWMGYAKDRGLLAGDPALFARNRLVVIVPKTNPGRINRLQDLARGGVKLVIGADAVPVGHYSRVAIRNLSHTDGFPPDYATRVLQNVVSDEENVRSVVSKVQLGEADAGFAYRSDVTPAVARYVKTLELPEAANVVAAYPIALVKDGRQPEAAKAFLDLVLSPEGQKILVQHGFMPVAAAQP